MMVSATRFALSRRGLLLSAASLPFARVARLGNMPKQVALRERPDRTSPK